MTRRVLKATGYASSRFKRANRCKLLLCSWAPFNITVNVIDAKESPCCRRMFVVTEVQGGSARRNAYENIAIVIADKQWFQLIFNGRVMKCAIIVMRLKNLPKSILFIGIYWLCGLKIFGDTSCSRMR